MLARSRHATGSPYAVVGSSFYPADGNGNVTALGSGGGTLQASYKYDPYGRLVSQSGPLSGANLLRWSSKPWMGFAGSSTDGLYSYGYRFYEPYLQRWLNRDPIGEQGGLNLYAFVGNNPLLHVDPHGQKSKRSIAILLWLITGCRKSVPEFPQISPHCADDPEVKRAYAALLNCASDELDGSSECAILCDCLAQDQGVAENFCYDKCTDAYEKRCR